jgi:Uma2 family endonuclease
MLTAEQFAQRPDPGHPEELVRGRIETVTVPKPRHGEICGQAYDLIRQHVEPRDLGRTLCRDSGVITERDPDTVRGADVAFYSFDRVPRGPLPDAYLGVAPDLVVEVLSPSDRWPKVIRKVGECLDAGVAIVVVLDDGHRRAHVFTADRSTRMLGPDDDLTLLGVLPDFRGRVAAFFERSLFSPVRGNSRR